MDNPTPDEEVNLDTMKEVSSYSQYAAAIANKDLSKLKYLYEVEKLNIFSLGGTLIVTASGQGFLAGVEYLVDKGLDIHVANDDALVHATFHNEIETMKLLLSLGAHPNCQTGFPARLSSSKGYIEALKLLVEYGADVSEKSEALEAALKSDHAEIVSYLLQNHLSFDYLLSIKDIKYGENITKLIDIYKNKIYLDNNLEHKTNSSSTKNNKI